MLALALSVAGGGLAWGNVRVDAGDVLYLALEDTESRLQRRMRMLTCGQDVTGADRIAMPTIWRPLDEGGADALDAWLTAHPTARLVVVDTLKRIRPRSTGRGRAYDEDYDSVAPLKRLSDAHGVSIVVVHHLRKMAAEDPMDTISGTLGLTGAVDGIMVLQRVRGAADATLHTTSRDGDERELAMRFDPATGNWQVRGDAGPVLGGEQQAQVYEALAATDVPMSPKDVAAATGLTAKQVGERLHDLKRADLVVRVGRGQWGLPSDADFAANDATVDANAAPDTANEASSVRDAANTANTARTRTIDVDRAREMLPRLLPDQGSIGSIGSIGMEGSEGSIDPHASAWVMDANGYRAVPTRTNGHEPTAMDADALADLMMSDADEGWI